MLRFDERYNFTGKERDSETGYYYHGARYYDPVTVTGWTTVDPVLDKYPGISPYAYCAWNPVKIVDPDGREMDDYFSASGKYLGSDNANTRNVRIMNEYTWDGLDKDSKGRIDYESGNMLSTSFSSAGVTMSEQSQLNVYEHYNITGCRLEVLQENGESSGMRTTFVYGKKPVVKIRLKGNRQKPFYVSDHAYEIISLFAHEKGHIKLYNALGHLKYQTLSEDVQEQAAMKAQISDPSWEKTSDIFKKKLVGYGKDFGFKP